MINKGKYIIPKENVSLSDIAENLGYVYKHGIIGLNVKYRPTYDNMEELRELFSEEYIEQLFVSVKADIWASIDAMMYDEFGVVLTIKGENDEYWGISEKEIWEKLIIEDEECYSLSALKDTLDTMKEEIDKLEREFQQDLDHKIEMKKILINIPKQIPNKYPDNTYIWEVGDLEIWFNNRTADINKGSQTILEIQADDVEDKFICNINGINTSKFMVIDLEKAKKFEWGNFVHIIMTYFAFIRDEVNLTLFELNTIRPLSLKDPDADSLIIGVRTFTDRVLKFVFNLNTGELLQVVKTEQQEVELNDSWTLELK